MQTSGWILIQTELARASAVAAAAAALPGVVSADDVTGPYDVIVKVDDVAVLGALQAIPGVTRTLTCFVH